MRSSLRIVPVLLFAVLAVPVARAADPVAVVEAKRALQSAVNHAAPDEMLKARSRFEAMSAAEPGSAALHYWVAVADWRVTPFLSGSDKVKAARYCKDGIDHCDKAIALDPRFGEAIALKGGLQGMSIQFEPGSMMTLGPQSVANTRRAITLAPNSPRVWLLDGLGTLNKPEQFGGGAVPAGETLDRAAALAAADSSSDPAAPDWGHDDAFLWAGRAAMMRKDYAAAREDYRKALALNPGNGWVRGRLLPEAEKALADSTQVKP